jgi:hypothetical protein
VILLSGRPWSQLASIALGGILGLLFCRRTAPLGPERIRIPISRAFALASLLIFTLLLVGPSFTALYQPVWTSAVLKPADFVVALTAFVALAVWKVPPWLVVIAAAAGGVILSYWS